MNYKERWLKLKIDVLSRCNQGTVTLRQLEDEIDSSGLLLAEVETTVRVLKLIQYLTSKGDDDERSFNITPAGSKHLEELKASSKPLTDLQQTIIEQLGKKSYTLSALARAISQPIPTVKDALAALRKRGCVKNARKVGYYLTNRPPAPD